MKTWLCKSCETAIDHDGLCEDCQLEHDVEWNAWLESLGTDYPEENYKEVDYDSD